MKKTINIHPLNKKKTLIFEIIVAKTESLKKLGKIFHVDKIFFPIDLSFIIHFFFQQKMPTLLHRCTRSAVKRIWSPYDRGQRSQSLIIHDQISLFNYFIFIFIHSMTFLFVVVSRKEKKAASS